MIIVLSLRKVFIILPRFDLPGSISFPSYISLNARIALSLFLPPAISDLLHLCNLTVIFMKIRHGFCDFSTKVYLFRVCVRNCDIKNTFNPSPPSDVPSFGHHYMLDCILADFTLLYFSYFMIMIHVLFPYICFIKYSFYCYYFLNVRLKESYVD